ncbi:MFS transporter [Aspergillus lucknowensis]|uniref:Major facilitator superfamily domain-containing protein n=1 Tax=Aspergillus lucknowensis TaxID=176173 RepID=A0ABR4M1Z1_9EURO
MARSLTSRFIFLSSSFVLSSQCTLYNRMPADPTITESTAGPADPSCQPVYQSKRDHVLAEYRKHTTAHGTAIAKGFYDGEELRGLDPDFITLDSEAGENPQKWTLKRKWTTTAFTAFFCFIPPFASTVFAPALLLVMADLDISDATIGALQVSIFLFSFSIGPLFLAPISELYGRTIVVHIGNFVFIAFSIGSGFAQTVPQLSVCRLLAGLGGSASMSIFGGILADIWDLKGRVKASGLITTGILIGPVLGPLCGGWMSERASWRWTCWIPAIAAAVAGVAGFIWMRESYLPVILQRKVRKARESDPGRNFYTALDLDLDLETPKAPKASRVLSNAIRPVLYLVLDPVLCLLSIYYAFVFGELYLLVTTFSEIFSLGYGHSAGFVGVDLLAQGIGCMIGLIATMKLLDVVYQRQMRSEKGYNPESRLVVAFPGALILTAGLFIYGFTALRVHFVVPLLGLVTFSLGSVNTLLAIQLYIVDCFEYAASAIAAVGFLRFMFAGAFPLFGSKLFDTLGVDWGVGLLAFLSLGLGGPFLPLIYIFGKRMRQAGKENLRKVAAL